MRYYITYKYKDLFFNHKLDVIKYEKFDKYFIRNKFDFQLTYNNIYELEFYLFSCNEKYIKWQTDVLSEDIILIDNFKYNFNKSDSYNGIFNITTENGIYNFENNIIQKLKILSNPEIYISKNNNIETENNSN